MSNGYVDIEILIDENGNVEQHVIKHGDGASCEKENDAAILLELFEKGFGDFGDIGESGKDWEQINQEQTENPELVEAYTPSKPKQQKEKVLDLGFGV